MFWVAGIASCVWVCWLLVRSWCLLVGLWDWLLGGGVIWLLAGLLAVDLYGFVGLGFGGWLMVDGLV